MRKHLFSLVALLLLIIGFSVGMPPPLWAAEKVVASRVPQPARVVVTGGGWTFVLPEGLPARNDPKTGAVYGHGRHGSCRIHGWREKGVDRVSVFFNLDRLKNPPPGTKNSFWAKGEIEYDPNQGWVIYFD